MILQNVINKKNRKLKKPAPLQISAPTQCQHRDVTLSSSPLTTIPERRTPHQRLSLPAGGVCNSDHHHSENNGVVRRRGRGRKCCQLSMVDILRFHNEFHFSLHLQDHLRFSMGNFEGEWFLNFHFVGPNSN